MLNGRAQGIKDFLIKNRILTETETDCYLALVEGGSMNSHRVFRFLKNNGIECGSRQKISDSMRALTTKGFVLQEDKKITIRRTEYIYTPKKLEESLKPMLDFIGEKKHQQFDELFDRLPERETEEDFLLHSNPEKTTQKILAEICQAKNSVNIVCGDCSWLENDNAKIALKKAIKNKVKIKIYLSERTPKDLISWLKKNNIEVLKNDSLPLSCIIDDRVMYLGYHDATAYYYALKIPKIGLIPDFKRHLESIEGEQK